MNKKMRFWEFTSIFRSEKALLLQTINQTKWQKYFENFINLNNIVKIQDRQTLDEEIPNELAFEMCSISKLKFWLIKTKTTTLLYSYQCEDSEPIEILSVKDAFIKFGGHIIEEALDKSYAEIIEN